MLRTPFVFRKLLALTNISQICDWTPMPWGGSNKSSLFVRCIKVPGKAVPKGPERAWDKGAAPDQRIAN